jgi:hypothetical protein
MSALQDQFATDDAINEEIWSRSPALQLRIQSPAQLVSPGAIGAQQAMVGDAPLPWVPDLVGKDSRGSDGVIVIGSAYAGFIAERSTRRCALSVGQYSQASTASAFQTLFLRYVVERDSAYYLRVHELLAAGGWCWRHSVLLDLCRTSFVERGIERDKSGDGIVRKQWSLFEKYVDAADWTFQRLLESRARIILALGTIAEHGVLRLLSKRGIVASNWVGQSMWRFKECAWPCRYADQRLSHWLPKQDWWLARCSRLQREWLVLPVYHPAWVHSYHRYREILQRMRTE